MTLSQALQAQLRDALLDSPIGIASGRYRGMSMVNKFGRNTDVDTGTVPESVWDGGGMWIAPTAPRVHEIAAGANDAGKLIAAGVTTGGGSHHLEDAGADFVADGVSAGDVVLDDTAHAYGFVTAVAEHRLTIDRMSKAIEPGDTYRIATANGTGAAVVEITRALDGDWREASEYVILDGATPVQTARAYVRINRMRVIAAGSSAINEGNVTATAQVDGTLTAQISAGNGQTLMAIYTVPADKIGYFVSGYANVNRPGAASAAMVDVRFAARPHANIKNAPWQVKRTVALAVVGTSAYQHFSLPYVRLEPRTDIVVSVTYVSDDNMDVSAGFDIILEAING